MRTLTLRLVSVLALGLLATAGLGCDIFLPEKGGEGQPCLDNQTCDDGLVCRDGVCRGDCQDGCTTVNETRCALGTRVERCEQAQHGCLDWVMIQDCSALNGQVCMLNASSEAVCGPACAADCTQEGATRCKPGMGVIQTCSRLTPDCLHWIDTTPCGELQHCDETDGTPGCETGCSTCGPENARQCAGNVLQECRETASCLHWENMQDCTAGGQTCDDTLDPPACAGTCTPNCPTAGDQRCNANRVERCDDRTGCLLWFVIDDCVAQGQTCDASGGIPTCTSGCTNDCMGGQVRCNGSVRQDCAPNVDADPCLDWRDVEDCASADPVKACNVVAGDPPTTECSVNCNSTCTQGESDRCEIPLLLETCEQVPNFPTCYQWRPVTCTAGGQCIPCNTGYPTECDVGSGACVCMFPCGADNKTCCQPTEECDPISQTCETCVSLDQSCTAAGEPCCGNAACMGTCQECVGGQTACVDECCTPSQFCDRAVDQCVTCDPLDDGPACGDKCCQLGEVCANRLAGICQPCNEATGEVPCERVCCATSLDSFCLNPGSCAQCPGAATVCDVTGPFRECCLPPSICIDGVGCCDPGCDGLPCGQAPNPGCQPICNATTCSLAKWSLTLGGATDERAGAKSPSVAQRGTALDEPWALIRSESLGALLLAGFDEAGAVSALHTLEGGGPEADGVIRPVPGTTKLIFAGTSATWSAGSFGGLNAWLILLSSDLTTVEWNRVYGTLDEDGAFDIQPLPPSSPGWVVVGETVSTSPSLTSGLAFLVTQAGGLGNFARLKAPADDKDYGLLAVAPVVDDGTLQSLVAVGFTSTAGGGDDHPFAVGLNPALTGALWQLSFQSSAFGIARAVVADGTSSVVLVGEIMHPDDGMTDVFAIKLDAVSSATPTIAWQQRYYLAGTDEWAASITRAPDNTLLVSGAIVYAGGSGSREGWLLRISADDGHLMWQRRYGGPTEDELTMAIPVDLAATDSGYLAVGSRWVSNHAQDLWLLRTDEAGWIPTCNGNTEAAYTPAQMEPPGFNAVGTDASLAILVPNSECNSSVVSSGFTYSPEETLARDLDCQ
ncbi:MAG TPA: hypothetical protein PK668_26640 [Myxococcota bacterium]|nr:hypothetical protein [Myxococcota bacterium]HRY97107.1 hypothetical protein [Myxococcota bacterium]